MVDASVALQWIAPEVGSQDAIELLERKDLTAPDLLLVEVANALRRKLLLSEIDMKQAHEGLKLILDRVKFAPPDFELLSRGLDLAMLMSHPIYDCLYLALAERVGGSFVTRDLELLSRARRAGFDKMVSNLPMAPQ